MLRGCLWLWRRDGQWVYHRRRKRQHQAGFQNLPSALFRPFGILEFLHFPLCSSPALPAADGTALRGWGYVKSSYPRRGYISKTQPESPGQCPGGMSMGEGPRLCLDMIMPPQFFAVSWGRDNGWEQRDVVADRSVAGASCEGRARPWTRAVSC